MTTLSAAGKARLEKQSVGERGTEWWATPRLRYTSGQWQGRQTEAGNVLLNLCLALSGEILFACYFVRLLLEHCFSKLATY